MSRSRILRIGVGFVVIAVLLTLGLAKLSIIDHERWLERGLRNRWAFRDVPTRRGSITDATSMPLAYDVPGFDLELQYESFRRHHPVAVCVHAANLAHEAFDGSAPYTFSAPEGARDALHEVLAIPLASLRDDASWPRLDQLEAKPDSIGYDLRFYIGSAVVALSGVPRAKFAVALLAELREQSLGTVRDALARIVDRKTVPGFSVATTAREALPAAIEAMLIRTLDDRIAELRALDVRLRRARADRESFDLFEFLEERRLARREMLALRELSEPEAETLVELEFWSFLREADVDWRDWPSWRGWLLLEPARRQTFVDTYRAEREKFELARDEAGIEQRESSPWFQPLPDDWHAPRFEDEVRPRRVLARLPHELASWLAMLKERHPGFVLRASVLRERGRLPGHTDLASLASVVGSVGSYERRGRSPEFDAARLLAADADFARSGPELEAGVDLSVDLTDSLRARAEGALRAHYGRLGRVGRSGIEAAMDEVLAGRPGLRFVEKDKRARELRMFENLDVAPGANVQLSIDVRLQLIAEAALGDVTPSHEKVLVVIDAQRGDVLACVARVWRSDEPTPSWSIGAWAPNFSPYVGSVAKPLIALELQKAMRTDPSMPTPSTFPDCGGTQSPYDRARHLRCGEVHGAGSRDTVEAIAESCNVYFFRAADQLGEERVRACFLNFGWDRATPSDSVESPSEVATGMPFLPQGGPRIRPSGFVLPLVAIGYGVEVWPLFVARAYAGIATGRLPVLRFVSQAGDVPTRALDYAPNEFRVVRDGLLQCVEHGTAKAVRSTAERIGRETGLQLFGKTGTAEVTPDRSLNNAWFAGFVGDGESARLAFAAVEYRTDDHGGTSAAPIVARFLEAVLDDPQLRAAYLDLQRTVPR